jgi:hypothetical protein
MIAERTVTMTKVFSLSLEPSLLSLLVFQVFVTFANCDISADGRLSTRHSSNRNYVTVKLDGDLIFGGLFPMHDSGDEMSLCGAIKEEKGIQRLEAMLYAIDMINADYTLLPNVTIGKSISLLLYFCYYISVTTSILTILIFLIYQSIRYLLYIQIIFSLHFIHKTKIMAKLIQYTLFLNFGIFWLSVNE